MFFWMFSKVLVELLQNIRMKRTIIEFGRVLALGRRGLYFDYKVIPQTPKTFWRLFLSLKKSTMNLYSGCNIKYFYK